MSKKLKNLRFYGKFSKPKPKPKMAEQTEQQKFDPTWLGQKFLTRTITRLYHYLGGILFHSFVTTLSDYQ